jgi:hypothetical protein
MKAPTPRGPVSSAVLSTLELSPNDPDADAAAERLSAAISVALQQDGDLLEDGDLQLGLFLLFELHYTGIEGVSDLWEWDRRILESRRHVEDALESVLRRSVDVPELPAPETEAVAAALFELTAPQPGPSLSHEVAVHATDEQLHEFLIHRSIYTLKEADPHSWAIPRLSGRAKAALVEVQSDEYGGGRPSRMHSALFAQTMRGLGLDDSYGHYVDAVPAITLASLNTMSLFGLNRRLRGAICGHLAAFEMTSSLPNRMYGDGFRRLGYGTDVTWYFDEHVEADSVHEQIAGRDLAGGLAEQEPELLPDIMFGAAACLYVDGLVADHVRLSWNAGRSSLREPVSAAV